MTNPHSKLPLPQRRSPAALDDKILHYAQSRAEQQAPKHRPLWIGGLATASVAVLAVYLVLPAYETVPVAPASLQEEATVYDQASTMADSAERDSAAAPAAMAETEAPGMKEFAGRASAKAAAVAPANDDMVVRQALPQARMAPDTIVNRPVLSAAELERELNSIRGLLAGGERAAAEQAYLSLREKCPACNLPAELNETLLLQPPPP
jgi:hypothetical protein